MARWHVIVATITFFGTYLMFLTSVNIWKTNTIQLNPQSGNAPVTLIDYDQPIVVPPLPPIFSMSSTLLQSNSAGVAAAVPPSPSKTTSSIKPILTSSSSSSSGGGGSSSSTMMINKKLLPPPINMSWSGLYACYDYGEVFAASFLASSEAFLGMKKYKSVLKSHRAAHASHYLTWERQAHKTLDFLDFFVEHLSAYERVS
jgi:hypothetical protein